MRRKIQAKNAKRISIWAVILVFAMASFVSILPFFIDNVSAESAYEYNDSYSMISGPHPKNPSDFLTFKKTSGGKFVADKAALGADCARSTAERERNADAIIALNSGKYDRSTSAKLSIRPECSSGEVSIGPITIGTTATTSKHGEWIDHSHIRLDDGSIYLDGKIDDTVSFKITNGKNSCEAQNSIDGFPHSGNSGDGKNTANANATVQLHIYTESTATGNSNCVRKDFSLKLTDPDSGYDNYFRWVDSGTITTSDGATMRLSQEQGKTGGLFFDDGTGREKTGNCKTSIEANPDNPGRGKLVIRTNLANPFTSGWPDYIGKSSKFKNQDGCKVTGELSIAISDPINSNGQRASAADAGSGTSDGTLGSADGSGDAPSIGCKFGIGILNPLNWLLCGAIKGMVAIISVIDDAIMSQLAVGTDGTSAEANGIFCDSGNCLGYYRAWQQFRNIALGLMVIAGLVIVIAQVLGTELLDAYTLRKTLPRLLIAAIGLTLSWQLMEFFVTLSNSLGYGIRYIIYHAFYGIGDASINVNSLGANGALLIYGAGGIVFGGFGLLTLAGSGAVAVLIAFVVLVLRQIAIIMLTILAPIAIIAYILPNTQRVYKFWWESFSKALLMFPLIAALIATGHVFSAIAANDSQNNVINQMVAIVAYFVPYFLVGFTFRFAGGALAQIGGFVNDRGSGLTGALRKRSAEKRQKRREVIGQKFRTGDFHNVIPNRFQKTNRAYGRAMGVTNSVGRRFGAGIIRGGFGFGPLGETARMGLLSQAADEASKEPGMVNLSDHNGAMRLMARIGARGGDQKLAEKDVLDHYLSDDNEYGKALSEDAAKEKVREARALVANAGGWTAGRGVAAVRMMGRDGTAIRNLKDMASLVGGVSEGNENMAYRLLSQVGSDSAQRGRGELNIAQEKRGRLAAAAVKHHLEVPDGVEDPAYDRVIDDATMAGAGGMTGNDKMARSPSRVIRGSVESSMSMIERYLDESAEVVSGVRTEGERTVKFDEAAQAASVVADLQDAAQGSYAKTDNKIALHTAMTEDRLDDLKRFMQTEIPDSATNGRQVEREVIDPGKAKYPGVPETTTVKKPEQTMDYVRRLIGERYASKPEGQIAADMAAEARERAKDAEKDKG